MEKFRNDTADCLETIVFLHTTSADLYTDNGLKSPSLIVTEDSSITELIDLHIGETAVSYPQDGYAVINENLSKIGDYDIGDSI